MKASGVFKAAYRTYHQYGDEDYARNKAYIFLRRCGGTLEVNLPDEDGKTSSPDDDIPKSRIDQIVYAMLDSESEKVFWNEYSHQLVDG